MVSPIISRPIYKIKPPKEDPPEKDPDEGDDENKIPDNVFEEFKVLCALKLGDGILIEIQDGSAMDSPINRQNEIESNKQLLAEESVSSDPSIQKFLNKFGSNIKEGSIKPIN
jgi:hypothetical protein